MLDDHGFEVYETNPFPIAYLLTFRTYGSWLHGDERWSINRNVQDNFRSRAVPPNKPLHDAMAEELGQPPFLLDALQRTCVKEAIVEVCDNRGYLLRGVNVRSNHAHSVVSAAKKPEPIANEFKAYATRRLRREFLVDSSNKIWSRGASTRYLWKPRHVEAAVDYVLYCQEDIPFEFQD